MAHLYRGWDLHDEVVLVLLDESDTSEVFNELVQDILDEVQAEDPVDNELSFKRPLLFDCFVDFGQGSVLAVLSHEVKHDVLVTRFKSFRDMHDC